MNIKKLLLLIALLLTQTNSVKAGFSTNSNSNLWPGGNIPYEIDPNLDEKLKNNIIRAAQEWSDVSIINFTPRLNEFPYLLITDSRGGSKCRADVGYSANRIQKVYLDVACDYSAILHELGHSIGLHHEHQRPDRDQFVTIDQAAIRNTPGGLNYETMYAIKNNERMVGPYDQYSIMHYDYGYFENLKKFKDPKSISRGDIATVEKIYSQQIYKQAFETPKKEITEKVKKPTIVISGSLVDQLVSAVRSKNISQTKTLLSQGADPFAVNSQGVAAIELVNFTDPKIRDILLNY